MVSFCVLPAHTKHLLSVQLLQASLVFDFKPCIRTRFPFLLEKPNETSRLASLGVDRGRDQKRSQAVNLPEDFRSSHEQITTDGCRFGTLQS